MVKPKYTINDRVYILSNNKVDNVIICAIYGEGTFINHEGHFSYPIIIYDVSSNGSSDKITRGLHEDQLFKTKKDLIKSL